MSEVEDLYNELALKAALQKIKNGVISDYTISLYNNLKRVFPDEMKNISLEGVACFTANWNPGKCNIGEKSQIETLQKKYPTFKKLSSSGKNSITLYRNGETLTAIKGIGKSNIIGIRTFDAVKEDALYSLKTVDIGQFSDNVGGGGQDKIQTELDTLIDTVKGKKLLFQNKEMKLIIAVDGRSADNIIANCQKIIGNSPNIIIGKCEAL
jgi:hypothetical protein